MFERNTLTFNPGWTSRNENLSDFTDIREIRQELEARGIVPASVSIESDAGPGSLALIDPDGNPVLLDQHAESPPNSKNS